MVIEILNKNTHYNEKKITDIQVLTIQEKQQICVYEF